MRRKIILALMVIIAFLLQSTIFQDLSIASTSPNLLLILTVSYGLMCGRGIGIFTGFFSGLMIDIFYGEIFGLNALVYMWIGYVNGSLFKVFFDEDIKVPMVLVTISDLVYGCIIYITGFLLRGRLNFGGYLMKEIVPEMVYTVVITLLIYRLLYWINQKLLDYELEGQQSPWLRR